MAYLLKYRDSDVGKIVIQVVLETMVSVIIADALTAAGMALLLGTDFSGVVSIATGWKVAVGLSTLVSATVTPIFAITMAIMMRRLSDAKDDLARIAHHDPLTGLFNRRGFDVEATAASARSRRSGRPIAALMCDIDHFKSFNDRYGHEFGDVVLETVARLLRESLADRDAIIGRQGGEEFVALLPGANFVSAVAAAELVRSKCAATPFEHDGQSARVTMSIGVAVEIPGAPSIRAILSRADAALYKAKQGGRDQVAPADFEPEAA